MCSSTPSLEISFDLNDSGSSSTSPSRLPRMLVENQPRTPNIRALKAGAMTVFIKVWPVLKSLPAIGTSRCLASCQAAGKSTVKFGAPLAKGMPSWMHAQAYICELVIPGSLFISPASNDLIDWWVSPGGVYASVEPHHTATPRTHSRCLM